MNLEIRRDDSRSLADYASVGNSFVTRDARVKSYDEIPDNAPSDWAARFDVSNWTFVSAWQNGRRIGGAIVVTQADAVKQLEGRDASAVLWDIRVAPEFRGRGVGRELVAAVERVALDAHATSLDVETQDVNVAACCMYAAVGFSLLTVTPDAYPGAPGETKLVWTKTL